MFAINKDGFVAFGTSILYEVTDISYPAGVMCPPVVATGEVFSCSFAYMGGTNDGLQYDYGTGPQNLPANERKYLQSNPRKELAGV